MNIGARISGTDRHALGRAVWRVCLLGGLAAFAAALWAGQADAAGALKIQFSTRVAAGERPKIVLVATEAVGPIDVALRDETGKSFTAHIPRLSAGAQHTMALGDAPGRHRYEGHVTIAPARPGGAPEQRPVNFETVVAPNNLQVTIDRARVDLGARRLEARLSRPADRVEVQVQRVLLGGANDTGTGEVVRAEHNLRGQAANAPLIVTWPAFASGTQASSGAAVPGNDADVARIDLKFFDTDGFFASVALLPWRVFIPHEEVTFATDSDAIEARERPKLEASFTKIATALQQHRTLGPVRLYLAGHTDSVGAPAHNLTLSRGRALAIARWFRRRGLRLPIAYEGFGEQALAVATPDETAEARNRRVDYILALEDPVLGGGRVRAAWKSLP